MRNVHFLIFLSIFAHALCAYENPANYYNSAASNYYGTHSTSDPTNYSADRTGHNASDKRGKESQDVQKNTRSYVDGISELTTDTYTPLNIGVTTPAGQAIGSVNLQKRVFTETVWEFSTNDLDPKQNIFDERGRGVLVDGNLSCRITHRETLSDYYLGGLTLGLVNQKIVPGVTLNFNGGVTFEKLKNNYWESTQICAVGPIPSYTTTKEIAKLCAPCHQEVAETLKQDVRSRMNALTYLVNTNLCKLDSDCDGAGDDGRYITANTIGRCVLIVDKNNSYYSECRTRTLEGRGCPGPGSSGMLEYKCDRGLECVKTHEGAGFWNWSGYDYSKYVCLKRKTR